MQVSEDRISHLAHQVIDHLKKSGTATYPDEARALQAVKQSIAGYFSIHEEIDDLIRKKLASYTQAKVPGSREWEILYHKFYKEELDKRKW
jgi:hypothetical protein